MIVAISSSSLPAPVEEFRSAPSESAAVASFCAEYSPALDPLDYQGLDTGWSEYAKPPSGYHWSIGLGGGLTTTPNDPELVFHASSKLVPAAGVVITTVDGYELLDGVSTSADFFVDDLSKCIGRVVASVRTVGSGAVLRLVEKGSPDVTMGTWPLGDTAGAWVPIAVNTTVAPSAGQNEYHLQATLGTSSTAAWSAEIRSCSLSLLEVV